MKKRLLPYMLLPLAIFPLFGCGDDEGIVQEPVANESPYFDAVIKCNGTTLAKEGFSVAPNQRLLLSVDFDAKEDLESVECIICLVEGKVTLDSGHATAKKLNGRFSLKRELKAPPMERPKSIVEVRDSTGTKIGSASLPVKS